MKRNLPCCECDTPVNAVTGVPVGLIITGTIRCNLCERRLKDELADLQRAADRWRDALAACEGDWRDEHAALERLERMLLNALAAASW